MPVFRRAARWRTILAHRRALSLFALIAALVVIVIVLVPGRPSTGSRMLELELTPAAGTAAQVYWSPGREFAEERSARVPFSAPLNGAQRLRFPLPETPIQWLRIDPTDAAGDVLIQAVRVIDSQGHVEGTLNPGDFTPASGIASVTPLGDAARITTAPDTTDPFLHAGFACVERETRLDRLARVTTPALAVVTAVFVALLAAATGLLGRAVLDSGRRTRWTAAIALSGLFAIIVSAKLLLMYHNPVTVPYWDQWNAEATSLYVPFNQCTLTWPQMFGLHNEHRIFFTRLLALDLLIVNGQWDPRLQQVVNAAMHAFTGVLIAAMFWVANGKRRLLLIACSVGVIFAPPFAWDNTLMGFQSAFYFLLLLSMLALWLTTRYRAGSAAWFLGCACAILALFTSAGGVITIAAVLAVAALKLASDWRDWRPFLLALVCCAAMLWLGIQMLSPPIPAHDFLKAHTAAEFLSALVRNLAWPWVFSPGFVVIVWLPVGLWLLTILWRRGRCTEFERLNAGLSAWVVLNAAAIAFGRGMGGAAPATRYMDFLSLGVICNAVALMALIDLAAMRATLRRLALGGLALWLIFAVVGVDKVTRRALVDLGTWRRYSAAHETNVRRYVLSADMTGLAPKLGPNEIPFPEPYGLASVLQEPYIRRVLPAAIRQPLHVEPRLSEGFVTGGRFGRGIPRDPLRRYWWSLAEDGRKGFGQFESEPIRCQTGGSLRFDVSGYLGWAGHSLVLRDVDRARDTAIAPTRIAREDWTDVATACPSGLFSIVAVDQSPESWFGFREPIEIAWGSVAAEWLIHRVGTLFGGLSRP